MRFVSRAWNSWAVGAFGLALAPLATLACGCNVVPSRDPVGEYLPPAEGKTLAGVPTTLAESLAGAPAVLLVPYTDDAQFDAEVWALGLAQLGTPVRRFELGVVPSAAGVLLTPAINVDRRNRRAEVKWPDVLCFSGDGADALATQTGLGSAQYARVLLVDHEQRIVWFCDQGFTAERVLELDGHARALAGAAMQRSGSTPDTRPGDADAQPR
jgi:hypothetical protein